MEVTTQYSSASARTMAPDTLADEAPAANGPRAQPKVFPEALGSAQFAAKPNDGLSKQDPEPFGRTPPYVGAGLSHPIDTLPSTTVLTNYSIFRQQHGHRSRRASS